ncbi:hypothetical protein ES319_D02G139700v1, partial [Gossypium barbadense]
HFPKNDAFSSPLPFPFPFPLSLSPSFSLSLGLQIISPFPFPFLFPFPFSWATNQFGQGPFLVPPSSRKKKNLSDCQVPNMGFSFWLARLCSCSNKSAFSNAFRDSFYHYKSQLNTCLKNLPSTIAGKTNSHAFSWSNCLLPLAFAISAGSLTFQSHNNHPSLYEPSNLDSHKTGNFLHRSASSIPYGGATSIEGHTLSPNGGVCIDMTLMKRVKALHIWDMDVVVEPGIGWMELNEYLEPYGLFFPVDPGPGATIGGMCATRCSGSLAMM